MLRPFTTKLFDTRLDGGHFTAAQHRWLREGHLAAEGHPGVAEARRAGG